MSGLLLVAYHDLVRYAVPLALFSNVAYIFGEVPASYVVLEGLTIRRVTQLTPQFCAWN